MANEEELMDRLSQLVTELKQTPDGHNTLEEIRQWLLALKERLGNAVCS